MSENEMSEDEKQSWKTIFDSLCKENSYELDKDDIRSVFTIINSNRKANGQKEIAMSDEEFETIFADVDADDSGQIDFDEFVAFVQMAGKGKISGLSADFDVTIGALEAARYKPIFDRVDEDCDGELSKDEVKRLFHLIQDEKKADSETVWEFTNEQVDRLFEATDIDNSGSVDFEEFVILLQRLEKGEMKHIVPQLQRFKRLSLHGDGRELNMLRSIFNEVDDDESGELDRDEAKIFFEKVNMDRKKRGESVLTLTDENFDKLFAEADADNSGNIDFEEIVEIMSKIKKGALQDIMNKQFTNMISTSKREKVTAMTALQHIEDTYDASKHLDAVGLLSQSFLMLLTHI